MTYFDTQQQNPAHNSQFNPQAWAASNSQAAQPHGPWTNAPWMQAIGGYGQGGYGPGQAAYGQQHGQYGGQPSFGGFGYNAGWGAQPPGRGQTQPQWAPRGGQQQTPPLRQDGNQVGGAVGARQPQTLRPCTQARRVHGR